MYETGSLFCPSGFMITPYRPSHLEFGGTLFFTLLDLSRSPTRSSTGIRGGGALNFFLVDVCHAGFKM